MICPSLHITTKPNLQCRCTSTSEISEVKTGTINQYCATDQYEKCPQYNNKKKRGISQAVYHKVFRAVG